MKSYEIIEAGVTSGNIYTSTLTDIKNVAQRECVARNRVMYVNLVREGGMRKRLFRYVPDGKGGCEVKQIN